MDEVNELPQGWKWVKLGDVCELINGRAYKAHELLLKGKTPVLRVGNLFTSDNWYYSDLELEDNKYCNNGDLLYCWSTSFGVRIWGGEKAIFHYHIWKIEPSEYILKYFLYHVLENETVKIKASSHGATMPHITKEAMEKYLIPLPPTIQEQQRLATLLTAKLSLIEQAKEKITAQLQAAQELTAAYLREVFESEEAKGWELVKLGDVCKSIVPNRDKPKSFSGSYRWITLPDFNENTIYLDIKENYLGLSKEEILEYNARIVPKGSVIMSCVGRFGLSAIVEQDIIPNQQIHAFVVPKEIDYKYLAYFLKFNKDYFESIATSTIINYLNKSNCESVLFPLLPLIEQQKISNYLSEKLATVEQLKSTLQTQLDSINQLPAALLKQAFSGKL